MTSFFSQFGTVVIWRKDLATVGNAQPSGAVAVSILVGAVRLVLPLRNGTPPGDGAFHLQGQY